MYEPFLGSGTTLTAEQSGRLCCGMELDPKYVDVVVARWQAIGGRQARLDGDGRSFDEIASSATVDPTRCALALPVGDRRWRAAGEGLSARASAQV